MRIAFTLLAVAAALYLLACGAVIVLQRSMIYYPQPAIGAGADRIKLAVPGAQIVVSVRSRAGAAALIYFGGNAEDVSSSLPELAQAFPERAIYAMHYRGYGGSTGAPAEAALQQDALVLFDTVEASHADVVVMGRSLGTGIAVRLATTRAVSGLVLVTPYDSLRAIAATHFSYLPVRWLLRDTYDSDRYAPAVKVPTLLLAAEHDDVIPRSSTERLLASFPPGIATMKIIPATGHNTISASPAYIHALRSF